MRGFTAVRDMGGPIAPLKAAIDAGKATGPRAGATRADRLTHRITFPERTRWAVYVRRARPFGR